MIRCAVSKAMRWQAPRCVLRVVGCIMGVCAWAHASWAATAPPAPWEEGTHYHTLAPEHAVDPKSSVVVREFFSYACPWCYRVEAEVESMRQHLPAGVDFERVPVVFHEGWERLAKAYHTLVALDQVDNMHALFFAAVQNKSVNFQQDEPVLLFFEQQGLAKSLFRSTYRSFGVERAVRQGQTRLFALGLKSVPAVVVDGRYHVSPGALTEQQGALQDLVLWLVHKAQAERSNAA